MSLRVIGYVPAWVLSLLPTTDLNRCFSLLLMFVARTIRRTRSSTDERGSVAAVDTWPLGALTRTSMTCDNFLKFGNNIGMPGLHLMHRNTISPRAWATNLCDSGGSGRALEKYVVRCMAGVARYT